jgi:hypothetical protein
MPNDMVPGKNETTQANETPLNGVRLCTVPGRVYENLDQDVIHVTSDRAHRCLDEWRRRIEAKGSWVAPLSLAAGLLMRLTADFKDKFDVPKEHWAALCFVGFLAALLWLVRNVIRSVRNTPESSDQIVERLKGSPPSSPL